MPRRLSTTSEGTEGGGIERATKRVKRTSSSTSTKSSSTSTTGGAPPLGKFLASSEKPIRDKAVASLTRFLSAGKLPIKEEDEEEVLEVGDLDWDKEWIPDSRFEELEVQKLWKGIYYCFWMSDKPLVQQALAQNLSDLVLVVRPKSKRQEKNGRVERVKCSLAFLKGFWETVSREWVGLDRLRIDKFYMLIRRFVQAAFRLLEREEWDLNAIKLYNEILTGPGGPLHVESPKTPHSLTFHVTEIFLDELERNASNSSSSSEEERPIPNIPLVALLQPYMNTLTVSPSSTIFNRIIEQLFKPLLESLLPVSPTKKLGGRRSKKDGPKPQKPSYPGILSRCLERTTGSEGGEEEEEVGTQIAKSILKSLFENGGKSEVDETNRRKIYMFVAEYDHLDL